MLARFFSDECANERNSNEQSRGAGLPKELRSALA